jgi:hypothetical protein
MKIEFKIGKEEYELREMTVADYYQIKTNLFLGGIEAHFEMISILSGCPVAVLREAKTRDFQKLVDSLEFKLNSLLGGEQRLIHQFVFEDVEYGLVNLDAMTIGEFADLDVIVTSSNADSRLHEMLAILYRPITRKTLTKNVIEKYDAEGFRTRSELFKNLPITYARAVSAFFLHIARASIKATLTSLRQTKDPMAKEIERTLQMLLGDGTTPWSISLEEIRLRSQELQNLVSERLSTSSLGNTTKTESKRSKIKEWLNNINLN